MATKTKPQPKATTPHAHTLARGGIITGTLVDYPTAKAHAWGSETVALCHGELPGCTGWDASDVDQPAPATIAPMAACNGCRLPTTLAVLQAGDGLCPQCYQAAADPDTGLVSEQAALTIVPSAYATALQAASDGLQPTLDGSTPPPVLGPTELCADCEQRYPAAALDPDAGNCPPCKRQALHDHGVHGPCWPDQSERELTLCSILGDPLCPDCKRTAHDFDLSVEFGATPADAAQDAVWRQWLLEYADSTPARKALVTMDWPVFTANPTADNAAAKYEASLRSALKRAYAAEYGKWLRSGQHGPEPRRPDALSYMAAQAVRLNLHDLYPTAQPTPPADPDDGLLDDVPDVALDADDLDAPDLDPEPEPPATPPAPKRRRAPQTVVQPAKAAAVAPKATPPAKAPRKAASDPVGAPAAYLAQGTATVVSGPAAASLGPAKIKRVCKATGTVVSIHYMAFDPKHYALACQHGTTIKPLTWSKACDQARTPQDWCPMCAQAAAAR